MVAGPSFDAAVQDECVDTCVCACTSMCAHVHEHVRIHVCRRVFLRAVCILTVHEIAVECSHRVSSERQVNDRDERQRLFKNLFLCGKYSNLGLLLLVCLREAKKMMTECAITASFLYLIAKYSQLLVIVYHFNEQPFTDTLPKPR